MRDKRLTRASRSTRRGATLARSSTPISNGRRPPRSRGTSRSPVRLRPPARN